MRTHDGRFLPRPARPVKARWSPSSSRLFPAAESTAPGPFDAGALAVSPVTPGAPGLLSPSWPRALPPRAGRGRRLALVWSGCQAGPPHMVSTSCGARLPGNGLPAAPASPRSIQPLNDGVPISRPARQSIHGPSQSPREGPHGARDLAEHDCVPFSLGIKVKNNDASIPTAPSSRRGETKNITLTRERVSLFVPRRQTHAGNVYK